MPATTTTPPVPTEVVPTHPRPPAAGGMLQRGNLPAIFRLALQLHRDGHYREAERIYRRIVATDPADGDALHLLGLLYHQVGEDALAVDFLRQAVALRQSDASVFRHLGEAYRALQRFDDAVQSFERALALDPEDTDSICNLGHALLQRGSFRDAEICYRRVLRLAPEDAGALTSLGVALTHQGRADEAGRSYEKALALVPGNVEARHMLAALRGEAVRTAPPGYVVELFDRYAATFEAHVTDKLGYAVPELLRQAVTRSAGPGPHGWRIADLGCGTGLCGARFHEHARHLVGADLSERMIERARRRRIYDTLLVDDLTAALDPEHAPLDLVLAGDVFIYVGDLEPVFRGCAKALADGGRLAFSTERDGDDSFTLRPSGRFAHSERYVRDLAAAVRLAVVGVEDITVRIEQGRPVAGQLFVLQQRDAGGSGR